MLSPLCLIDTHLHLCSNAFDADRAEVLARAAADGVTRLIEVGYNLQTSRAALALAEQHPQIFAVVGVQPNYAHELSGGWLDEVRALAAHPKAVAIGEIGLDYHWNYATPEQQEPVFHAQLGLARDMGLPVVIHSRDAANDTLRILGDAARDVAGVMHSFSGDWDYAASCLEIGFFLSLSGPLTFPKATELHEVARRAPLDRLLTETDSPYLSPHPLRGRRNEPARVRLVAEQLAALRNTSLDAIGAAVWQNAANVFWKLQ